MNSQALHQALAAVPEGRRLKLLDLLHKALKSDAADRLKSRLEINRQINACADHTGTVTLVFTGTDCDGFKFLYSRSGIPATTKQVLGEYEDFCNHADGSVRLQIVSNAHWEHETRFIDRCHSES